jgi:uncharacterized membrane protein
VSTYRNIVGSEQQLTIDEIPADRGLIDALLDKGVIDKTMHRSTFCRLYPRRDTESLVLKSILAIAGIFLLFGFSMVIAANWNSLDFVIRLGVPQLLLIACLAGALWKGLDQQSGKLFAAAIVAIVGGNLIVLSQEFQQNAEAPVLFGRWLLFALPIVFVARHLPLWVGWIVLLNTYLFSVLETTNSQFLGLIEACFGPWPLYFIILPSVAILVLREAILLRSRESKAWDWLRPSWSVLLLLIWSLSLILTHLGSSYVDLVDGHRVSRQSLFLILDVTLLLVAHWYYRHRSFNLWLLAVTVVFESFAALTLVIITVSEISHVDATLIMLVGMVTSFGFFLYCFRYLRSVRSMSLADKASSPTAPEIPAIPAEHEPPSYAHEVKKIPASNLPQLTAAGLIDDLSSSGRVDLQLARTIAQNRIQHNTYPLYLRVLIGIGAFTSGAFFLGLLGSLDFFDRDAAVLLFGGVLISLAIYIHLNTKRIDSSTTLHAMRQQVSFAMVFAGKFIFVVGANQVFEYGLLTSFLALLAVTCSTYFVYDMYVDRLMSSTATMVAFGFLVLDVAAQLGYYSDVEVGTICSFVIMVGVPLAFAIIIHPRISQAFSPVGMGLLGLTGYLTTAVTLFQLSSAYIAVLAVAGTLIATLLWACGGRQTLGTRQVVIAIIATLLMASLKFVAPIMAIAVIILGYAGHDRLVSIIGSVFLLLSLAVYTRALDLGLMESGGILLAGGLILIAVYWLYRCWVFANSDPTQTSHPVGGDLT